MWFKSSISRAIFSLQVAGDGEGGRSDSEPDGHQNLHTTLAMDPSSRQMSGKEVMQEDLMTEVTKKDLHEDNHTNEANGFPNVPELHTGFKEDIGSPGRSRGGPNILPFEFRALEACLEAACSSLGSEVFSLLFQPCHLCFELCRLELSVKYPGQVMGVLVKRRG